MIKARELLLRLVILIETWMKRAEDYSLNDPEWNELQNEVNAIKNSLRKRPARTIAKRDQAAATNQRNKP